MSPEECQQLAEFDRRTVMLGPHDVRWGTVQSWQRQGLVRVVAIDRKTARVDVTDAGRTALREGWASG